MTSRTHRFALLAAAACALGGLALAACSSSTGGNFASDGGGTGADASHGGHDAAGGGNDATFGNDTGSGDDGSAGDDGSTSQDTGTAHDTGAGKDTGAGHEGGADGGAGDGGGTEAGSDGSGGTDAGSDALDAGAPECGATPTLHQEEAGTLYCGFGADGGTVICTAGQECCLGGSLGGGTFAPQVCAAQGATCTNGGVDGGAQPIPIECSQISDCRASGNAGATACCLQGATDTSVAGCGYPKYSLGTAIVCEGTGGGAASACATGETQICSSQADCPTGKTCTAGKWKIYQLGFCL